jgi:hypothetical protein
MHVVEMVNTAIEFLDKSGNVTSAPQSLLNFFANHINANQSDPFVFYDNIKGQFVTGVLDYAGNGANYVDFATGVDSSSGITWTLAPPIPSGEAKRSFDYPRAGYNADAYFIEANMFQGSSFKNVQVITVSKTGSVLSRHDDSSLFTLTPAMMHGATSGGPEYFLASAFGGGSALQLVTETKVTSSSPSFSTSSVAVPAYSGGGAPPGGVASFDDRIFDVAFRTDSSGVGHLVAAHQVAGPSGVAVVARWYDINAGTNTLIQSGNAPAGVSGASTFMPTVDINTAGSIGMTFDESASTENWSMYVTLRTTSDATGTMEAAVKVANGLSTTPDSRVGDFSGTSVDPSDGLTFWSANQYQGNDFWDTHIASYKSSVNKTSKGPLAVVPGSATGTGTPDRFGAPGQLTDQTVAANQNSSSTGQPQPEVLLSDLDVLLGQAALATLDMAQASSPVIGSPIGGPLQAAGMDDWWASLSKQDFERRLF